MEKTEPIRKVVSGVNLNTDTAHCFKLVRKIFTEHLDGEFRDVHHLFMIQGLYRASEGQYFLALWNQPQWNSDALSYDFVDEAILIEPEKAKLWVQRNCPEKLEDFLSSMNTTSQVSSMQTVSLRMHTGLRDHLAFAAKLGNSNKSLSKHCVDLIEAGMSLAGSRSSLSPPNPSLITMPDGTHALDGFEKALKFDDSDEQALAGYAEALYALVRFNYAWFLPFVLKTLYTLLHKTKNDKHALCFANWLTAFYRPSFSDAQTRRPPSPSTDKNHP